MLFSTTNDSKIEAELTVRPSPVEYRVCNLPIRERQQRILAIGKRNTSQSSYPCIILSNLPRFQNNTNTHTRKTYIV